MTTAPPASDASRASPFVGLNPFGERDAAYFFGREYDAYTLAGHVLRARLTVLFGASGSGKSSLIHAALLAHLRAARPGCTIVTWNRWQSGFESELLPAMAASPASAAARFLVFDQFEEWFEYARDPVRTGFAEALARLVNTADDDTHVLIALREDSLALLDRLRVRIPDILASTVELKPLDLDAARDAIVKPIAAFNRLQRVDAAPMVPEPPTSDGTPAESAHRGFVEEVIEQVRRGRFHFGAAGKAGSGDDGEAERVEAPFLQLALMRLWEEETRQGSTMLTVATLRSLKGAAGIAEELLRGSVAGLDERQQRLAARLFRWLVTPTGAKHAYSAEEMARLVNDEADLTRAAMGASVAETMGAHLAGLETALGRAARWLPERFVGASATMLERRRASYAREGSALARWIARIGAVVTASESEIDSILRRLAQGDRRILRTQPNPLDEGRPLFELFHDALARPVLGWSQGALFAEMKRRQLRRIRWGFAIVSAFAAIAAFSFLQYRQAERARIVAEAAQAEAQNQTQVAEEALEQAKLAVDRQAQERSRADEAARRAARERDAAQAQEARAVATLARQEIERGDTMTAMAALLEVLPDDDAGRQRPITSAATMALYDAWLRNREIATLAGHDAPVFALAFSRDGRRFATASSDGTARLWSIDGTRPSSIVLDRADADPGAIEFSGDGQRVLTMSRDGAARVWNIAAGPPSAIVLKHGDERLLHAGFSPDGSRVVTTSEDATARVWDLRVEPPTSVVLDGHAKAVSHAAFSPDGGRLATASWDGTARVWDLRADPPIGVVLAGHADQVRSVRFSRDGRRLVTASDDRTARVWSLEGARPTSDVLAGHERGVLDARFLAEGRRVLTWSDDGTVRRWNLATTPPAGETVAEQAGLVDIDVSFDERRVVLASSDRTAVVIELDRPGLRRIVLTGHGAEIAAARFSPDGARVATSSFDRTARLWDVAGDRPRSIELTAHDEPVEHAAFSADSRRVVTSSQDRTARIWDLDGERATSRIVLPGHEERVVHASFSPDGRRVVTASWDRSAMLWELENARAIRLARLEGHDDRLTQASFSPDGRRVLTASMDWTLRLWDVARLPPSVVELRGPPPQPNERQPLRGFIHAAFSPDGRWVLGIAARDARLWLWDASAASPQPIAVEGHRAEIVAAHFRADSREVATIAADGTARFWDLSRPASASRALEGLGGDIWQASFSRDLRRLVTSSWDSGARLWDLAQTPPAALVLEGHDGPVRDAQFSPDGDRLVTTSIDRTARLWDMSGERPVSAVLSGHRDAVLGASFSPDARRMLTLVNYGQPRLWPHQPDPRELIALARRDLARCLTASQRDAFGLPSRTDFAVDRARVGVPPCR